MTFGFAQPPYVSRPPSTDSAAPLGRMLEPAEWASAGIPLLRNPREVVAGLYARHLPGLSTVIVAVLDPQERVIASASFTQRPVAPDGWEFRNALLTQLRRIVPHDLRLRVPVRTAVLLYCRAGEPRWTEADGAWMWGLRDACTLHGLRCGAYITLTGDRWQVLGEGRGGRRPRASAAEKSRGGADRARTGARDGTAGSITGADGAGLRHTEAESPRGEPGPEPAEAPCAEPRRTTSPGTAAARTESLGTAAPYTDAPPGSVTPPVEAPGTPEALPAAQPRPPGPAAAPPQRITPQARTVPPPEQPRSGGRGAPRRAGGGAAEAHRHTAAR
ncbi:hypothetical protein GCM10010211_10950 [Streptomyces albospinus]|uniref:Uncharacterized protein n=1 Tax=Streptomyces albospinus TaxID=285515 RepID=A0ABQ2UT04_9ACTN|nr:hypothetical protein GCM10010211_10950 [Streptomyces albospinus]